MTRKLLPPLLLAFILCGAACTRTGDTPPAASATPAPAAGPARTYTAAEDRDYCGQLAGLYLRYDGEMAAGTSIHSLNGGLRVSW